MNPSQQEYQTERAINTRNRIRFHETDKGATIILVSAVLVIVGIMILGIVT